LIRRKSQEGEAIEMLLLELGKLYNELDDITNLPQKMGFADKGTFEIFMQIKNARANEYNEELVKEFAKELVQTVIIKKIYIGWQELANEVNRLRVSIEIFAAADEYHQLHIDDDLQLMDTLMQSIVKNFEVKS
jgi:type I restriction enzyme, R subunit